MMHTSVSTAVTFSLVHFTLSAVCIFVSNAFCPVSWPTMVLRIYLPTWSSIFGNRNLQAAASVVDQDPTDEEHVVYLDTDSILLPTKPPPPYAAQDPNPVTRTRYGRRPVAVLGYIEYIEQTTTTSSGDTVTTMLAMRESDINRRVGIRRRRRRREWELSQAVLSVVIFFLAIVGIAWLGSVAVSWTWPEKTERAWKFKNWRPAWTQDISMPSTTTPGAGIHCSTSSPLAIPSNTPPTVLRNDNLSPDTLAKIYSHIGKRPIYDCFAHDGWVAGRLEEDRSLEMKIWRDTHECLYYNRAQDFWCMYPCPPTSSISTGTEKTTATTHELQAGHPSQPNEPCPSVNSRKCRYTSGNIQYMAVRPLAAASTMQN